MTLKRALSLSLIVGFLCVGAIGCGDDSDEGTPGGSGGSGGATGGTGGSTGGSGGMSGSGGGGTGGSTGGSGGSTGGTGGAPSTMMCGTNTCNAIMSLQLLPPCCTPTDTCGVITNEDGTQCTELSQPGVLDESCPAENNALGAATPGCCKPTGECGLMSMTLMMSCVERTEYPAGFLESQVALTDSIPCGDADGGI